MLNVVAEENRQSGPVTVSVHVHKVASSPVASVDTTLLPGMIHTFTLGPTGSGDHGQVVEVSPTGPSSDGNAVETMWCASVRCAIVEPEFDGSTWNDVVTVRSTADGPVDVNIRVYDVGGGSPNTTRRAQIGIGSPNQDTVPAARPRTTSVPGAFVEAYVTPELTERGWVDALYVQTLERVPAVSVDGGVIRVEIGNVDEQLASLRDDTEDVCDHASLDSTHSEFLHARLDDVGVQLSAGHHAGARALLVQFTHELQSLVEMEVLSAAQASALTNPATALVRQLSY